MPFTSPDDEADTYLETSFDSLVLTPIAAIGT